MAVPTEFPHLLRRPSQTLEADTCRQRGREAATVAGQPTVVALFNIAMVGHLNPTFALVQELVARGCRVHYFLPPGEDIRAAARESGAVVEGYLADEPADFSLEACGDFGDCLEPDDHLSIWPLASTLASGEHILARCRELGVQLCLFDPMAPHGLLAAGALGVPGLSLVTYPGLGSIAEMLQDQARLERWRALRRPLALEARERFGVDLGGELISRLQWLSEDGNLVTTSELLLAPLPPPGEAPWADEVREHFTFTTVGCLSTDTAPHVASAPAPKAAGPCCQNHLSSDFPTAELAAAAARGARVVYAALGTMALSARWAQDLGGSSGGNLPPGTTGKAFCQHVWRALFAAMRELGDGYHCVVSVGKQADALDFLEADGEAQVPENVTLRASVQQLEMLSGHAHAFLSHAGFNSLQESLVAGVPLVAVPQAVDQPANARRVEASGWGQAFLQPMDSVCPRALAAALREVAAEDGPYRAAVAAAKQHLCGGEARAAEHLLAVAGQGDSC
mmetsp:Transcript_66137/g.204928  ORF Transcript_66137/g.204928 Transcript_66137/m.204928 type:complete len:509 (+) Transcript_66137:93-1619(+)